jgi:hypothetical protein
MILKRVIVIKKETSKAVMIERRDKRDKFLKKLTEKRLSINKTTTDKVGKRKREELLASCDSPQGRE